LHSAMQSFSIVVRICRDGSKLRKETDV